MNTNKNKGILGKQDTLNKEIRIIIKPQMNEVSTKKWNRYSEYRNWISTLSWDYFCVFTFKEEISKHGARKAFMNLCDRIKRFISPITAFMVIEPNRFRNGTHIHVLIKFDKPLINPNILPFNIANHWEIVTRGGKTNETRNNCYIDLYNPSLKGCGYICKRLNSKLLDDDFDIYVSTSQFTKPTHRRKKLSKRKHHIQNEGKIQPKEIQDFERRQILKEKYSKLEKERRKKNKKSKPITENDKINIHPKDDSVKEH